jgi:hypothetical protein
MVVGSSMVRSNGDAAAAAGSSLRGGAELGPQPHHRGSEPGAVGRLAMRRPEP